MMITCDAYCNMGYIYLQPPSEEVFDYEKEQDNALSKYIDSSEIKIPYETNLNIANLFNKMRLSETVYEMAVDNHFGEEYYNDLDENGYVSGIELNLTKERFIDFVKNQAFKVIQTEWKGLTYHLITFDYHHKVFESSNIIYPLSNKRDGYLIVEIRNKIGFIKALLTSRDDLYPKEYLLTPQFILMEYT